ncbi:MAG: transporter substrate-binding domain-containing protein [Oscillospiraceae bacterium]|jgi:ABC-type amino acid transport substrate-binding protein|nr:transporter substrate-binding domain-containing protein [Oscillospiraceae bacterium]
MKRLFFAAMAVLLFLTGCAGRRLEPTVSVPADVEGRTIGAVAGTSAVRYAARYGTIQEYASREAMLGDLAAGAIDCAFTEFKLAPGLAKQGRSLRALPEPLFTLEIRIAAARESADLIRDLNAALTTLRDNGTLALLRDRYVLDKKVKLPDTTLPESEAALRLAVAQTAFPPYCGLNEEGILAGFDIDLAHYLCRALGVSLEIVPVEDNQLLDAVRFGKADFAVGGLYVTEASIDLVTYSDPYTTIEMGVVTRK